MYMKKTKSNDPSSATAGLKPSNCQPEREPAVRCSALVRQLFQTPKTNQNSIPIKVVNVLNLWQRMFSSLSVLLSHLESHPKSLEVVGKNKQTCLLLKSLLSQWQESGRPEITWQEFDRTAQT